MCTTGMFLDLKPDNVGFTSTGALKLFDFGLVTCVNRRQDVFSNYAMTGYTGSLRYMAPEVAQRLPYNEKVDVYSYGIMVWQMARDKIPFKGLYLHVLHACIHVCVCVCVCCVCVRVSVCMCERVSVCVCMYVCVY